MRYKFLPGGAAVPGYTLSAAIVIGNAIPVHEAALTVMPVMVTGDPLGLDTEYANAPAPVSVADFNDTVFALALNRPNANTPTTSASTRATAMSMIVAMTGLIPFLLPFFRRSIEIIVAAI